MISYFRNLRWWSFLRCLAGARRSHAPAMLSKPATVAGSGTMASAWLPPAAMAKNPLPVGTSLWPKSFAPHPTSEPSFFNAMLKPDPAAIAAKSFPPGIGSGPTRSAPHASNEPSVLNARLWREPADTAAKSLPSGTSHCP